MEKNGWELRRPPIREKHGTWHGRRPGPTKKKASGIGGNAGRSPENIHDDWITERFGTSWGENPLAMTVADQDPKARLQHRSRPHHAYHRRWRQDLGRGQYSHRVAKDGWTTTGLDVTTSLRNSLRSFRNECEFITYTDIGLFRSEDGGAAWTSSTDGVPREWRNTTYWVVFDPKVKRKDVEREQRTHDSRGPKCGGTLNLDTIEEESASAQMAAALDQIEDGNGEPAPRTSCLIRPVR